MQLRISKLFHIFCWWLQISERVFFSHKRQSKPENIRQDLISKLQLALLALRELLLLLLLLHVFLSLFKKVNNRLTMHWETKNLSHGLFVIVKGHCKHSNIGLQCILVLLFIHNKGFSLFQITKTNKWMKHKTSLSF